MSLVHVPPKRSLTLSRSHTESLCEPRVVETLGSEVWVQTCAEEEQEAQPVVLPQDAGTQAEPGLTLAAQPKCPPDTE